MSGTPHPQEILDALELVTQRHKLKSGYRINNFFAIAVIGSESDLEKEARDGFRNVARLPSYVYIHNLKQLHLGNRVFHYALACGVYSIDE